MGLALLTDWHHPLNSAAPCTCCACCQWPVILMCSSNNNLLKRLPRLCPQASSFRTSCALSRTSHEAQLTVPGTMPAGPQGSTMQLRLQPLSCKSSAGRPGQEGKAHHTSKEPSRAARPDSSA